MDDATIRDTLRREDEEFRRWAMKHEEFETRLAALRSRHFLTEEEKREEVELKKRKLLLKDQMEARVRQSADAAADVRS
jgi:uncharacterized protein YdcH (DUF465 family)